MARGQKKTLEEKIAVKRELIAALTTRIESEKRELDELYGEKKKKELEAVSELISDAGLSSDEVAQILQEYIGGRAAAAS